MTLALKPVSWFNVQTAKLFQVWPGFENGRRAESANKSRVATLIADC